jgi:hypothetical protein
MSMTLDQIAKVELRSLKQTLGVVESRLDEIDLAVLRQIEASISSRMSDWR